LQPEALLVSSGRVLVHEGRSLLSDKSASRGFDPRPLHHTAPRSHRARRTETQEVRHEGDVVKPRTVWITHQVLYDLLEDVERIERRLRGLAEETTIFGTADGVVSARIEGALRIATSVADRLFRLVRDCTDRIPG
jgi:hypothetical protein